MISSSNLMKSAIRLPLSKPQGRGKSAKSIAIVNATLVAYRKVSR